MLSDRTVGNIVNFTCNSGYILYGPISRKCTSLGTWTERNPSCISKHLEHICIYMYVCSYITIVFTLNYTIMHSNFSNLMNVLSRILYQTILYQRLLKNQNNFIANWDSKTEILWYQGFHCIYVVAVKFCIAI